MTQGTFNKTYTDRAAATSYAFAGRKVCRERANEVVCIGSVYFHVPRPTLRFRTVGLNIWIEELPPSLGEDGVPRLRASPSAASSASSGSFSYLALLRPGYLITWTSFPILRGLITAPDNSDCIK